MRLCGCVHFRPSTENIYIGSLRAIRRPELLDQVDAVLNLSGKQTPFVDARHAYASVYIPDVADHVVVLPKLIYAVRWLVVHVRSTGDPPERTMRFALNVLKISLWTGPLS